MKNNLILIIIAFMLITSVKAQLKILSGIEKGSYNAMAKDILKICGDKEVTDTVKEKLPIYVNGYPQGEKDTMYVRTSKETFITIKTTGGSNDNYRQLVINRSSNADVAFMQYDVLLLEQLKGLKRGGAKKKDEQVRVLLPLGNEQIHLITRATNRDIDNIADLKDKRVGIGTKQSGTQSTALCIQEILGIEWISVEWDIEMCLKSIFNGQLDAFFFVGAAPVKRLKELSSHMEYEIRLVPIEDENLLAYYPKAVIKNGYYSWSKEDIQTFGVPDALVTNVIVETKEKSENIKKMLTDIKSNIDELKKSGHPKWQDVNFDFSSFEGKLIIDDIAKEVFGLQ